MKKYCYRFRVSLITFALGLVSVFMVNGLLIQPEEMKVDLPEAETESSLIVFPMKRELVSANQGGNGCGGETVEEFEARIKKEKMKLKKVKRNRQR